MVNATIAMDQDAERRWSHYLDEIRNALSPLPQQELEDIIEELESHLSSDLTSDERRLSDQDVSALIARLGPPQEMADAYGIESEPQEALSVIDLTLLVGSLVLMLIGVFIPLLAIVFLVTGVVLARIALQKSAVMTSPYRYLAYPALLVGYFLLAGISLLWPLVPVLPIAATGGLLATVNPEYVIFMEQQSSEYWTVTWSLATFVTAVWWLILSRKIVSQKAFLKRLFEPFFSPGGFPAERLGNSLRRGGLLTATVALLILILAFAL